MNTFEGFFSHLNVNFIKAIPFSINVSIIDQFLNFGQIDYNCFSSKGGIILFGISGSFFINSFFCLIFVRNRFFRTYYIWGNFSPGR